MSTDWWIIVRVDDAVRCWPAGPDHDDAAGLLDAARVLCAVAADDDWVTGRSCDIQITRGEPHHTLLKLATVGTAADLLAVDPALVAAHRTARAAWTADRDREHALAALAGLDDDTFAAVLAEPDVAVRVDQARGRG